MGAGIIGGTGYKNYSMDAKVEAYDIKLVCALEEIDKLQRELADMILLYDQPEEPKSVFDMSYEEYMDLLGNVRL